jgi:hypothetical protein
MIPNLRQLYGRIYRVGLDPCATSWQDVHMHVIPTRTGEVFVHGERYAGVEVEARRRATLGLMRRAGYSIQQDGDDVKTFLVPWEALEQLLPLLQPFKRRQVVLTEEQRGELVARMERINASRRAQVQTHSEAQGSPIVGQGGPGAA